MREIKFRAWDMSNKKMIYVQEGLSLEIHDDGSGCISDLSTESILEFSPWEYQNRKSFDDKKIMADAGILMQYTGLKDKNGKEIYEGDIIRWNPDERKVPIGRNQEVFWDDTGWAPFRGDMVDGWKSNRYEIIGNIYENPELLK